MRPSILLGVCRARRRACASCFHGVRADLQIFFDIFDFFNDERACFHLYCWACVALGDVRALHVSMACVRFSRFFLHS